eukprot:1000351-Pelagomonas_calceolata.AAC.2
MVLGMAQRRQITSKACWMFCPARGVMRCQVELNQKSVSPALKSVPEAVSEEQLVSMLEQINEQTGGSKPKITIQRRRYNFDDDE